MVVNSQTERAEATHARQTASQSTGRPGIELHNLHYAGRHRALDGVDLSVGNGVLGLLGPNGTGKTTLLRVLATVLKSSKGSIRLLGRDPCDPGELREIRRRLGYLPQ